MKNCTNCKHAQWKRTEAGRLHPSGDGRCAYPWKMPPIPAAMYWIGTAPTPTGGYINRRKDLRDHCTYFTRAAASSSEASPPCAS